jgi:hypothetical protein
MASLCCRAGESSGFCLGSFEVENSSGLENVPIDIQALLAKYRRQTAARQEICRVQRTSCSWCCTWEQIQRGVPKAGSKRGLWETETEIETFLQLFGVQCSSCLPEGRSKRSKHLGHLVQDMEK